ncbi:MAG: apolipoprotein N-acyltransferase [Candidatus Omnitrophica bacterium]|nr:apolipoprotein N-acyltransferase [Candidatus Omnitrophota bacterium]
MFKKVLFASLSAILLSLAFPKPGLGFLAWFALVPWFFALQKEKPLRAFLLSYLVGLIFFSGTLYWVNYVSGLGFSILVAYLALYFAIFGFLFSINYRQSTISNFLVIPCLWVALEYIRSHLFTGFGWALLGYSQYSVLPLIQISDITGAYGVSFLIVLVNLAIWQTIRKKILFPVFCIFSSLILVLGYGYFKLNQPAQGQDIKVAVVQGNIPQRMKWDPQARDCILQRYLGLTEEAARSRPEIIIWPETSVPGFLEDDPQLLEEISSLSKKIFPSYLLVGTPQEGEQRSIYNSATLLLEGEILQRYDKLHLVPFGEFIPWPQFFSRFSFAGLIGNFSPGEVYTVFSSAFPKADIKFSALICFEDVFAHLARSFVRGGAKILVNMTNDAWFEDSSEPYQHLQASVFRAVENRVNVVRSANTGVSCFINPWGKILGRVSDSFGQDLLVEGEKTQALKIISMPSFYTAFGDIFAWLCLIGIVFSLIRRRRRT